MKSKRFVFIEIFLVGMLLTTMCIPTALGDLFTRSYTPGKLPEHTLCSANEACAGPLDTTAQDSPAKETDLVQTGQSLQRIKQRKGKPLLLDAQRGIGIGPEIQYMPEWKAFGWFHAKDRVEWDVEVVVAGNYNVILEWSVSDEEAGKEFVLEIGGQQLKGVVGKSGSWETFKRAVIGDIRISKGRQRVIFRPVASEFEKGTALLDLRAITLKLTR